MRISRMRAWMMAAASMALCASLNAQAPARGKSAAATTATARGAHSSAAETELRSRLQAYLERTLGWQQLDLMEIVSLSPPDGSGVRTAVVHLKKGTQQVEQNFFITPDGKEVIAGGEIDPLSGDPWAAVRGRLATAGAPTTGPAKAPVTIVEFSDLECPYCKQLSGTLSDEMKQEPDKIRLIFKYFPMTEIHPWSMAAAEAAVCVAAQSSSDFWSFEDATFAQQDQITPDIAPRRLRELALAAGAQAGPYDACMAQPSTQATVEASLKNGHALGVVSTPTIFINGRMIPGAIDGQSLRQLVDSEAKMATTEAAAGPISTKPPTGKQCDACGTLPPIIHR